MGGDLPKQFMPVAGEPVLMRTLSAFHAADPALHIILVLPLDHQAYWKELCEQYRFTVAHEVATGGETRFHSVQNGLPLVPDDAEGVVLVHDGVRPFVAPSVIRQAMEVAWDEGTAVPVVPVVETVRQLCPEGDSQTVSRDSYRLVQTPQAFRISLLREGYQQTYQPEFTDDASVVEALGYSIVLTEGNRENIKITTPSDLKYAEFLCRESI